MTGCAQTMAAVLPAFESLLSSEEVDSVSIGAVHQAVETVLPAVVAIGYEPEALINTFINSLGACAHRRQRGTDLRTAAQRTCPFGTA